MSRPLSEGKSRRPQTRIRTSRIKPFTVELSNAFKVVAQGINRIEALLEEIVRHLEGNSDDDNEDDANEIDIETDDFNKHKICDGNIDRNSEDARINESRCEDSSAYFCPDEECKTRKADRTWKQYVRHYETHVPCKVSCAVCPTVSRNVAALKRHYIECPKLKQKRDVAEYKGKLFKMKCQRDTESEKASAKAQEMLKACKRRLSDMGSPRSRKKARPALRSESSHGSVGTPSRNYTVTESSGSSPTSAHAENASEHCEATGTIDIDNGISRRRTSENVNSITDEPFLHLAGAGLPAHGATIDMRGLELMDPTTIYPSGDQQPAAQPVDTLAGPSSPLTTTVDESTAAAQMLPALDSALFMTKALSFGRHTMDGSMDMSSEHIAAKTTGSHPRATSIYYPDGHYLEGRPTGQSLSYSLHTMDGSANDTADQFYTQDADLHPWSQHGYSTQ